LVALGGCSNISDVPPHDTYPVSGKVLLPGGEPAAGAVITFHPQDPPGKRMALAEKDGTFRLGTFGKDDGAIPGRYVVTVEPPPNPPVGAKKHAPLSIPKRYRDEETSPWRVEVKAQEQNVLPPYRLQ
jgi:hypothetical protein